MIINSSFIIIIMKSRYCLI